MKHAENQQSPRSPIHPSSFILHPSSSRALVECLTAQHGQYEAFLALAREQLQMISEGRTSALLETLGRKQNVLARIDELERQLAPLKASWPELRDAIPETERIEVEAAIDHVREILAEVIELERQSERELVRRKDQTRCEIDKTARGEQVHQAYGRSPRAAGGDSRFLDTRE